MESCDFVAILSTSGYGLYFLSLFEQNRDFSNLLL